MKISLLFLLVFSFNASALNYSKLVDATPDSIAKAKKAISELSNEADKYKVTKNIKEKEFILTAILQDSNSILKEVPEILKEQYDSQIKKIKKLRNLLKTKDIKGHDILFSKIHTDIKNIETALSLF